MVLLQARSHTIESLPGKLFSALAQIVAAAGNFWLRILHSDFFILHFQYTVRIGVSGMPPWQRLQLRAPFI